MSEPESEVTAEPEAEPVAAETAAPPRPAQFGGSTPVTGLDESAAAKEGPGYAVAKPLLTTGDAGSDVAQLAHLLAAAGHPNSVAAGLKAPILDDELMRIVREFQDANGIDPTRAQSPVDLSASATNPGDNPPLIPKTHQGIVEAATWAALLEAAGADVDAELKVTVGYQHKAASA